MADLLRKRNRLPWYDYSQDGFYFVTLVVKNRAEVLSSVSEGKSVLTSAGHAVSQIILNIPQYYKNTNIDELTIMPNHLHIIIQLNNTSLAKPGNEIITGRICNYGKLSKIIKSFKCELVKVMKKQNEKRIYWQRSYYDHVIRDEKSYLRIKEYMVNNPFKWEMDVENAGVGGDSAAYYKKLTE